MEKGLRMIRLFWLEHQKHKTQYPNNLTGFNTGGIMSSTQTTSIMDTPWNHNIAYSYLPGNVYYNSSLENN